ncbi:cytochrome P450 [Coprinopsis sp. MPI-PUGE-AT-0042]|nr:cytochrome P450 [Coprinopsis sp. MPI-PUGE-AT-0042]
MTRPFFSRERLTDLDRFERHTQTALSLPFRKAKTGYAMDDQDVVQRLGLDVSTYTLLGSCTNALEDSTEDLALPFDHPQYSAAASNPAKGASLFSMPSSPLPTPHMEVVNRFVDPIIQVALRKNAANPKGAESNETDADEALLDHLARSTSDHKLLRDETLNTLLAGRDMSPAVLTFTAYFLAMRPEVMKKLREDILTQLGPWKAPTYDDARALKYLRAVINRGMRLLHPAPNDVRTPYGPILIHTRKDVWGPDADEFDPDRFIDDRVKEYLVPNPFIFIPFNAGPRICLGQQFAYNLMSFVLVRLLRQFSEFSLDKEALTPELRVPKEWAETGKNSRKAKERFRPHTVLTMSSKGGIWLKATLADA